VDTTTGFPLGWPQTLEPSRRLSMMDTWEAPRFEEIRMDAEIGSYQDDLDEDRGQPFVR